MNARRALFGAALALVGLGASVVGSEAAQAATPAPAVVAEAPAVEAAKPETVTVLPSLGIALPKLLKGSCTVNAWYSTYYNMPVITIYVGNGCERVRGGFSYAPNPYYCPSYQPAWVYVSPGNYYTFIGKAGCVGAYGYQQRLAWADPLSPSGAIYSWNV